MSLEVIEPFVVDVGVPHLAMVDHDAIVVVDGDEALVEGSIMEGVEQQSIGCCGFLGGRRCLPRFDVTGDQQFGNLHAGHAACAVVVLQE